MYIYNSKILIFIMLALYLSGALVSLVFYNKHKFVNILSNIISSTASVLGIYTSIAHLLGGMDRISITNLPESVPLISFSMNLDRLSAFFILALSLLTLCVSIYSIGYLSHYYGKRNVGLFNFMYNIFILSMIGVITSGNVIFFFISWEVMSLVSYFLVVFEGEKQETQSAGKMYLIITHIATSFLMIAFALMYSYSGSFEIGAALNAVPSFVKNVIFVCLLIGFGTKAGIIPLHVWLPYAHPAAPSNISSLMSGIMIKTAIYGLIRFVMIGLGAEYAWWGTAILIIGAVSAVLGVAFAMMEHNIKRLLAYSSIENMGIILIGLGISFSAYSQGNMVLCSLSMAAALFHLINHTIFKGALFLGAGAIHYSTHTKDLEKLGGLIKKMPYTGLFFLVASLSISAIPPFNGFVSEWLAYQSLFMSLGAGSAGLKLITLLAVAALAMAGALAAACFVKAFGISFLGLPRSEDAKQAREVPFTMLAAMGLLSGFCLVLGLFPALVLRLLDNVIWGLPKFMLLNSRYSLVNNLSGSSCFVYYPTTIGKTGISPFFLSLFAILLVIIVLVVVKLTGRNSKERKYGTWDCGFTGLNSRMQYSATGFSKPLRIVFRSIYRPARDLQIEEGSSPYYHKSMKYIVSTQPVFEKYLYRPVVDAFTRFSRKTRLSVQTGSVHIYLLYIFITMLVLLVYYSLN